MAMRVLFATDGSRSSDLARDLLASLPWPEGSWLRVVSVHERHAAFLGPAWIAAIPAEEDAMDAAISEHLGAALEAAKDTITRPGLVVDSLLLHGRPASAIVDEAEEFQPDLIVIGSRGHSRFESMLLGSVSSEVVGHAPCPVLVVRTDAIDSVILGDDGSETADRAARVLQSWPVFQGLPVAVVTVADISPPFVGGLPELYGETYSAYEAWAEEARQDAGRKAAERADELRRAGFDATPVALDGDPAQEIVALAAARGTDLVVVGTRGRGGLARLLLGSTARNILVNAHCSVLIVRAVATKAASDSGHRGEAPSGNPGTTSPP
jgi:nucleotide-binding universal stress UspA family protein